ncbi:MAG TPA: hypothetical protein DET40_18955 [Lentisphaeria bacterium]|nr:MAG: hypothetical protein A2X45_25410 [Lentisphaerae bacterium GWF2_50_93]HCE45626.1 hypothetical protein [Lentisphaeria bacterium]
MKKEIYDILLVGAGNLGSRHLQGLARLDLPSNIFVVDPFEKSLEISRNRVNEIPANGMVRNMSFCRTPEDTGLKEADLCIVASTADVRLQIIKNIFPAIHVSNFLLEKVLFQSAAEIDEASAIFTSADCKAWVNCPRRVTPQYIRIKEALRGRSVTSFSVSGGMWGLASNAIHFIDLLSFLCGKLDYSLDISELDSELHASNRPAFVDLSGKLKGVFAGGATFSLESIKGIKAPISVNIKGDGFSIVVNETEGNLCISGLDGTGANSQPFSIPRQSDMSHIIARDILIGGSCGLTSYDDSAKLHVPVLNGFLSHINSIKGSSYTKCPIT